MKKHKGILIAIFPDPLQYTDPGGEMKGLVASPGGARLGSLILCCWALLEGSWAVRSRVISTGYKDMYTWALFA